MGCFNVNRDIIIIIVSIILLVIAFIIGILSGVSGFFYKPFIASMTAGSFVIIFMFIKISKGESLCPPTNVIDSTNNPLIKEYNETLKSCILEIERTYVMRCESCIDIIMKFQDDYYDGESELLIQLEKDNDIHMTALDNIIGFIQLMLTSESYNKKDDLSNDQKNLLLCIYKNVLLLSTRLKYIEKEKAAHQYSDFIKSLKF